MESHEGVHHVFLLAREAVTMVDSMHHRLYAGSLGSEPLADEGFRAHMTVASTTSAELVGSAVKDIPKIGLPIRGLIKRWTSLQQRMGALRIWALFG